MSLKSTIKGIFKTKKSALKAYEERIINLAQKIAIEGTKDFGYLVKKKSRRRK